MNTIVLNGEYMETRELAHEYIKNQLDFPSYYGMNLDALWDLLVESTKDKKLILENCEVLVDQLGQYGVDLIETFLEAGEENPHLQVEAY